MGILNYSQCQHISDVWGISCEAKRRKKERRRLSWIAQKGEGTTSPVASKGLPACAVRVRFTVRLNPKFPLFREAKHHKHKDTWECVKILWDSFIISMILLRLERNIFWQRQLESLEDSWRAIKKISATITFRAISQVYCIQLCVV